MELKHKLKLLFTETPFGHNIIMTCPVCKRKRMHKECGFRHYNYRIRCEKCENINYCEYG